MGRLRKPLNKYQKVTSPTFENWFKFKSIASLSLNAQILLLFARLLHLLFLPPFRHGLLNKEKFRIQVKYLELNKNINTSEKTVGLTAKLDPEFEIWLYYQMCGFRKVSHLT